MFSSLGEARHSKNPNVRMIQNNTEEACLHLKTPKKFFDACETSKGWEGCKQYVADGAPFFAQCEPLAEIDTVEAYCEWMAEYGAYPCGRRQLRSINASGFDEGTRTAMFFGTYHLKHTGEGGPVPPTQKEAHAHYVYCLTMNADDRVEKMVKIWNAPWTMRELGWT